MSTMSIDERFLGIPYKFKGRDLHGVDCLGLVSLYLRSKGIVIPDKDGLPMTEEIQSDYLQRTLKGLREVATEVDLSKESPKENDILVMQFPHGYVHLGVMVDDHNMLHVLKNRPSDLIPWHRFRSRIIAVFRLTRNRRVVRKTKTSEGR